MVNQDPSHRYAGRCQYLGAVREIQLIAGLKSHEGFMHQCRRLESMSHSLGAQIVGSDPPQFMVNRQPRIGGAGR